MVALQTAIKELNTGTIEFVNPFETGMSTEGEIVIYLKKLQEYFDLNLTPTQIQEIDKLYAEKCKEVAEWKTKAAMNTTPLERTVSKLQEAKIIELKEKLSRSVNPTCRCNECKYFSTDGCAEDTMYCNLHGCYMSGMNGYCHRAEKEFAEMESKNE